MKREDIEFVKKNPLVARLLSQELPKMQPSALKHEFATSVANVMRHPVAQHVADDGDVYIIGFGDVERRLPLLLIEDSYDGTIRHAHVPYLNDPIQKRLVKELQENEISWCKERGVKPRSIITQIQFDGVEGINLYGLNRYTPSPPFNRTDLDDIMRGDWYPTKPLPKELEFDHRPNPQEHTDARKLGSNLGKSIAMSTRKGGPKTMAAALEATSPGKPLKIDRLVFEDPEEPVSEPEY